MVKKISFNLSASEINKAIREIQNEKKSFQGKCDLFINKLAEEGFKVANSILGEHIFTGESANSLRIVNLGDTEIGNRYALVAASKAILFFEFGAGVKYSGQVHPKAKELGMGPGSYPGKGHWDNPKGWWFPTDDPRLIKHVDKNGQGWGHSFGNPPYMPMYSASQEMIAAAERIAKEVFG